jgi:AraC-like DNA-binding protein
VTTASKSVIGAAFLPKLNSQAPTTTAPSVRQRKGRVAMPGSVTSVFGEAEDFEVALRAEGCLGLLVTGSGRFRVRLTQVALHRLRLATTDEHLARIALIAVQADTILVSLPSGRGPAPIWGGIPIGAGEIMTLGAGQSLHMRTDGPCRWGVIWVPEAELVRYGSALTGTAFAVPAAARWWRPRPAMIRHLRHLHSAAIDFVERRSRAAIDGEAAHGLEQQLIHALVDCLSNGSAIEATPTTYKHQDIALRFEALLQAQPERDLRMAEICTALGVSERLLRSVCAEHLGMSPTSYLRLRRMSLVYRILRRGDPDVASVSETARRYGFRQLGRFAADYRALFGELPSATLRRGLHSGMAHPVPQRSSSGV